MKKILMLSIMLSIAPSFAIKSMSSKDYSEIAKTMGELNKIMKSSQQYSSDVIDKLIAKMETFIKEEENLEMKYNLQLYLGIFFVNQYQNKQGAAYTWYKEKAQDLLIPVAEQSQNKILQKTAISFLHKLEKI